MSVLEEERISSVQQSSEKKYDNIFKLLTVGNSSVGKTSFVSRYCKGDFSPDFQPTVGIDYWAKQLVSYKNKHNILIQIWDTAGQERYQSVSNAYYRGANAFILMFDLTNYESYAACKQWITQIHENAPEEAVLVLVGNKSDLSEERKLSSEEPRRMAASMDIEYFESSVKQNVNIDEVIGHLVDVLIGKTGEKKSPEESPIALDSVQHDSGSSKMKCC